MRVAILVLAGGLAAGASAQLSPGELSAPHAGLEGAAHCLDCHAPRQGVAAERCLDCHGALRQRLAVGEGLHAAAEFARCETCHIEHHGRAFELIFWGDEGREAFDHRRVGWRLDGAHRTAACRDCHRPEHVQDPARLAAGNANLATTFLGLATRCSSCHEDVHRGQLGVTCSDCHTTAAFTPATGFDHAATDFPLVGAHAAVACAACHPSATDDATGEPFVGFAGVAHASCTDCHADPHRGRLGPRCAGCHTPEDWRRVDRAGFDHSRTRFPLTGLHRVVACAECHSGGRTTTRPTFASCADCHADPHAGRLGGACAGCHDTGGWRRVADGAFDHDRTRFPLRGEHAAVVCADCHTSGRPVADRLAFAGCQDCHGDPHRGQLTAVCADCHTVAGFVPSTFTVEDHAALAFPLDGAHLAVACVDCHLLTEAETLPPGLAIQRSDPGARRARAAPAEPVRRFRFTSTECAGCHADPHDGGGSSGITGICSDCHVTDTFRAMTSATIAFDHGRTGFALAGGHRGVACRDCHAAGSRGAPSFAVASTACASCHRDPHFGTAPPETSAMEAGAAVACADCHVVDSWRTTTFDHARDTGFVLDGAHARVACAACHARGTPNEPPPTTCIGCHGAGT